jgi:hypothetical protein
MYHNELEETYFLLQGGSNTTRTQTSPTLGCTQNAIFTTFKAQWNSFSTSLNHLYNS